MMLRSCKPPFIIRKSNISRNESFSYIRLECFAFSKLIPNYTWFDGEIKMERDGNFMTDCCDYDDGNYMFYLLIKRFSETYDTVYKCVIENKYGKCYAFFNIKKDDMFYPDIIPGRLIDMYTLNPRMVWKVSIVNHKFEKFQWYWGDQKISAYGGIFKDIALKHGNKNIIETHLTIKDPKIFVPPNTVHCLISDEHGNYTSSYTFFCLPPMNCVIITENFKIEANKKLNNKISVVIRIKYNTPTEPIVRWYNAYGYRYQNDEMHLITNTQEDTSGNYIATLHFKEYTKKTSLVVCKIRNERFDFLVSIDATAIEKKISDLEP